MSCLEILQYSIKDRDHILEKFEKTIEDIQEDVKTIRKWLDRQSHLPEIPDNNMIERFFLLNKCRFEVTKQKIDGYYSIRSLIPEFYNKNPNSPIINEVMSVIHYIPLPKLTKEYHRVVIIKARDTDVDKFDVVPYLAQVFNVAEIRLRYDYQCQEIHVYDLSGLKIGHFTKFTPSIIKKAAFVLGRVFSIRALELHFFNAPNFIDSFLNLLRNVLPPKLANRVVVHKGIESLYDTFSKDVLPKDYGGYEKSLDELSDDWKKVFRDHDELYQNLAKLRVNEELREKPLFDPDDIFGVQGNFKQLNVD